MRALIFVLGFVIAGVMLQFPDAGTEMLRLENSMQCLATDKSSFFWQCLYLRLEDNLLSNLQLPASLINWLEHLTTSLLHR
ncbi:hypothetical protein [Undibacterium sp. TJN19]|uniref:hypothetical protein n=1 Tax=Undibacterium sp. TJN19 TaxID=3413055 RepID=UPI003BF3621C